MSNCTRCQSAFTVTKQEEDFLERVSLPLPSLCPTCRMQGRFAWRNERKLYHRKCDLTGKQIISVYAPDSPYKVYDQHEWHSDKWDGMEQGQAFDFSRPFFEQFDALMRTTPKISVFTSQNVNSDYTNGAQQDKNCYMIFVSDHDEDSYYSYAIDSCQTCIECLNCFKCTRCIECVDCSESYNLAHCRQSHNCSDSFLLSDCKGCSDCFGCFGLRNKKCCIFNEQHTKEEYARKLKELNTGNVRTLQAARDAFEKRAAHQQIHQYVDGNGNENVTGDHTVHCRNCIECYDSADLEDCGHLIFSFKSKDCYDGHVVVDRCELCYGTISTINQYNTQFTFVSFYSKNSQYLDHCQHCEDCFACSGLKRKRFCIFNVQYTEQEYRALRAKIIEHMKKTPLRSSGASEGQACEWGQPLPPELSPFGYNETVAQEYFPLTESDVKNEGWLAARSAAREDASAPLRQGYGGQPLLRGGWKWHRDTESETSAYQGPRFPIPQSIDDVRDDITERILVCERSGRPFKIIPQELTLYREHHLPLPRLCFEERHLDRVRNRNPRHLWERKCMKCGKEVSSSFPPSRPEMIYCEQCYLKTIY